MRRLISMPRRLLLLPALAFFLLSSCAGYTRSTRAGLEAFERRDFEAAEKVYEEADEDGKDQLVYLLDRATVRYSAGRYEDSIKDLKLADRLSEIKDYTAIGTEIASVAVNDKIKQYKGEEFEHVLISVYLALNFAALGREEEAVVACRQVNRKLELLRDEGKRNYSLNAFAQYLAGLMFEKEGNWNNAYIAYKKTAELVPDFSRIKLDMVRGALRTENGSELHKWKRTMGVTEEDVQEARQGLKASGSVVLLYQNGMAPEKVSSPAWYEIPEYRPRHNPWRAARLYLDGKEVGRTELLYDVEKVAIQNLKEKYAGLIAKRVAGVVAREVIGDQLDRKAEGLGTILKIAMYAASQPDLRSWLTLPRDFQVARVAAAPGTYRATLRLEGASGALGEEKDLGEVEVRRAGDIALLSYRSL
jgi:hypothetical protein